MTDMQQRVKIEAVLVNELEQEKGYLVGSELINQFLFFQYQSCSFIIIIFPCDLVSVVH